MTFAEIMEIILSKDIEGGERVSDNPRDPGGLTKWGVSLRAHPELGREGILGLTKEKAIKIYREDYWLPGQVSKYPARLRLAIMDGCVNHGVSRHAHIVQKAANALGAKLVVDGVVGPKTLGAVKALDAVDYLVSLFETRSEIYRNSSNADVFGRGWQRRILRIAIES
jgi:lysozyme family protein